MTEKRHDKQPDLLEEVAEAPQSRPSTDFAQRGVIGQRFIEVVARPAQRAPAPHPQVVARLREQLALGRNVLEKHHQFELEEDDGINGGTAAAGIAVSHKIADKGKVEEAVHLATEMILQHCGIERGEDGTVEVTSLRWIEHCTLPFGIR